MELIGLRMVKLYVEEFFNWGFQQIDQQNDDGLDGIIIVRDRKGEDMGVRIHCQIKCGPSYLKGRPNKQLSIQPYSSKESLTRHLDMYSKMVEPTILIYINPGDYKKDGRYENGMTPPCWWIRLDDYVHDGSSVIKINQASRFGEHSKGDLLRIVKPLMKNWNNFPQLSLNDQDRKLWYSTNLKVDAKEYYQTKSYVDMLCGDKSIRVFITRIGWRHINKLSRGRERIHNSLKLLSVALRAIEEPERVLFLKEKSTGTKQCREVFYAIRVRLKIQNDIKKVQVVLRRWINPQKNKDNLWFYSVHIIK